jgi:hypothetical protein
MVNQGRLQHFDVAEVNTIGAGRPSARSTRLPHFAFAEHRGMNWLGEGIDRLRREDICRLTYADDCSELVPSSDTPEYEPVETDLANFTELQLTDHIGEAGFQLEFLRDADDRDETRAALVFSGRMPT